MIYTINGEEVEYIKIDTAEDKIDIRYYEKFNIVTAHTGRIERKLKDKNINVTVCKDLYHGFIGIFLEHVEDYIGVVHILEVPINAYRIYKEDKFLIIRIHELPKYKNKSYLEIIKKVEDK